jgi:hypothetical protein
VFADTVHALIDRATDAVIAVGIVRTPRCRRWGRVRLRAPVERIVDGGEQAIHEHALAVSFALKRRADTDIDDTERDIHPEN